MFVTLKYLQLHPSIFTVSKNFHMKIQWRKIHATQIINLGKG